MGFVDRIRFGIEYIALRVLMGVLGRCPDPLGRSLARGFGRLLGRLLSSRRRRAEENLFLAFPDVDAAVRKKWATGVWASFGETAREFVRSGWLPLPALQQRVEFRGLDRLRHSLALGKGVLLFSAHLGNWEMIGSALAWNGIVPAAIARRIKNPFVDRWIQRVRGRFGQTVIPSRSAVKESFRHLRRGGVLGILFDQRITDGELSVPFFGRPARTTGLPALLAQRTGCVVHPIHCHREGARLVIQCDPPLVFPPAKPTPETIAALMDQMTGVIEGWIRRFPDQWLWVHNRWKP